MSWVCSIVTRGGFGIGFFGIIPEIGDGDSSFWAGSKNTRVLGIFIPGDRGFVIPGIFWGWGFFRGIGYPTEKPPLLRNVWKAVCLYFFGEFPSPALKVKMDGLPGPLRVKQCTSTGKDLTRESNFEV